MNVSELLVNFADHLLIFSSLTIFAASIVLSIKTRFVQFRMLPRMIRGIIASLRKKPRETKTQTILAHRALFTAMSTTIGLASIVSPVLAIRLGGPGVLLGFMLAALLGSAVNFVEVTLGVCYRKRLKDGTIMGGPMQYLQDGLHPFLAKWYAFITFWLLILWSAYQSNQVADILASDLLGTYKIPEYITGLLLAIATIIILFGGIKRIGYLSAKMVPTMFFLYTIAASWIILANYQLLPEVFGLIFRTAFTRESMYGVAVGGLYQSLRWGLLKGYQANESGYGTATIPHSMAETERPTDQGILAMASIYTHGFICLLSGLVTLLTGTWQNTNIKIGINIIAQSFAMHFSHIGTIILIICTFLFAFGTIVGNSYNGSQCFAFITKNRFLHAYYLVTALVIFFGTIFDVTRLWIITDFFAIPVALPHIIAIVILAFKRSDLIEIKEQ